MKAYRPIIMAPSGEHRARQFRTTERGRALIGFDDAGQLLVAFDGVWLSRAEARTDLLGTRARAAEGHYGGGRFPEILAAQHERLADELAERLTELVGRGLLEASVRV